MDNIDFNITENTDKYKGDFLSHIIIKDKNFIKDEKMNCQLGKFLGLIINLEQEKFLNEEHTDFMKYCFSHIRDQNNLLLFSHALNNITNNDVIFSEISLINFYAPEFSDELNNIIEKETYLSNHFSRSNYSDYFKPVDFELSYLRLHALMKVNAILKLEKENIKIPPNMGEIPLNKLDDLLNIYGVDPTGLHPGLLNVLKFDENSCSLNPDICNKNCGVPIVKLANKSDSTGYFDVYAYVDQNRSNLEDHKKWVKYFVGETLETILIEKSVKGEWDMIKAMKYWLLNYFPQHLVDHKIKYKKANISPSENDTFILSKEDTHIFTYHIGSKS